MDMLANEKIEFFKGRHPPSTNLDTFGYFHWMVKTGMEFSSAHPRLVQAIIRVLLIEGMYYGKDFAEYHQMTTDSLAAMIKQAIRNGELDPSVDVELAVMVMDTWMNAITTYIMKEGMKQKDIIKWSRSAKTQETIDKLLYVMEYGLRKTESQFVTRLKGKENTMALYLRLAWRNIWRHKRRTIIIILAMSLTLALMMWYDGLMNGFTDAIYGNAVKVLGGNVQVHAEGYRAEANSNPLFPLADPQAVIMRGSKSADAGYHTRIHTADWSPAARALSRWASLASNLKRN
jgi:hypothetical protein